MPPLSPNDKRGRRIIGPGGAGYPIISPQFGSAFSIDQLPGLWGWYEANVEVTGSPTATAWGDRSLEDNNLTGTNTPTVNAADTTYGTSTPTIFFDSSDRMTDAALTTTHSQPVTIAIAGVATDGAANGMTCAANAASTILCRHVHGYPDVFSGMSSNPTNSSASFAPSNFLTPEVGFWVLNGASSSIWVGRTDMPAASGSCPAGTFAGLVLGNFSGGSAPWGKLIAAIACDGVLTASQMENVRLNLIARFPVLGNQPQVICDGNSITWGNGAGNRSQSYPNVLQLTGVGVTRKVRNMGVSGIRIDQMVSNFPTRIAPFYSSARGKNIIVLWEATNALAASQSAPTVRGHYQAYLALAAAAGFEVIVATTLPSTVLLTGSKETERVALNADLVANWASYGFAGIADVAAHPNLQNAADTTYYSDGTHPNATGYGVIEPIIRTPVLARLTA